MAQKTMSGFTRSIQNRAAGRSGSQTAFGIPTLDVLVEIVPGTVTAIYEDEFSFVHNMMLQIAVSQSLRSQSRKTYVLSLERKLLFHFDRQKQQQDESGDQKLVIAWRYLDLNPREASFDWSLSSKIPIESENVVDSLERLICTLKSERDCNIVIFSLFSPLFGKMEHCEALRLLFDIRKHAKTNGHTVSMSIPAFLVGFNPSPFLDNIIRLSSLLAMPHERFGYSCILELVKLASIGHLQSRELNSLKYGVKISSRRFVVEQIDIPPEDNTTGTAPCGSSF